jgi:DNA-binding NarL/FixJ family response regulator
MDRERPHCLILIDLRESTRLEPPQATRVMGRLEAALEEMNEDLGAVLAVPLTISYGDEVAGLLTSPVDLYDIASRVRDAAHPDARIRFVVARGMVGVPGADIRKVGGAVFKAASEAMQTVKAGRMFAAWQLGDPVLDAALTSLTGLTNALIEGMTAYQRRVFVLLRGGLPQKEIAARLGKLQQSVSDAVRRGSAELVLEGERAIRELLVRLAAS